MTLVGMRGSVSLESFAVAWGQGYHSLSAGAAQRQAQRRGRPQARVRREARRRGAGPAAACSHTCAHRACVGTGASKKSAKSMQFDGNFDERGAKRHLKLQFYVQTPRSLPTVKNQNRLRESRLLARLLFDEDEARQGGADEKLPPSPYNKFSHFTQNSPLIV